MSTGQSGDRHFRKKDIGSTKSLPEGGEGITPSVAHLAKVICQLTGGLK